MYPRVASEVSLRQFRNGFRDFSFFLLAESFLPRGEQQDSVGNCHWSLVLERACEEEREKKSRVRQRGSREISEKEKFEIPTARVGESSGLLSETLPFSDKSATSPHHSRSTTPGVTAAQSPRESPPLLLALSPSLVPSAEASESSLCLCRSSTIPLVSHPTGCRCRD